MKNFTNTQFTEMEMKISELCHNKQKMETSRTASDRHKNRVRTEITEAIKKEVMRWKNYKQKSNVEEQTLKSLKDKIREKDLVIEKTDKGNTIAVIER